MVPIKKLSNGVEMPAIGFGTWLVSDETTCVDAVKTALRVGYRHIDTAQVYHNEAFIGRAVKESGIARSELFITTKIWNGNMYLAETIPSFDASLRDLQMDYVDLLLMHFPVTELRRPAWRQMEIIANSGRAKAIGVSNYTVRHLEELLRESTIKPVVNQIELNVFLQQPELIDYCQQNDILVEAYGPMVHGAYGFDSPTIQKLAQKHSKTPAQIMLRWCVDRGVVPLPKSVHAERIKENFDIFDFQLSSGDMAELKNLDVDYRLNWDPTHVA